MLSRVAENLYWMARYIERAEDTARLLSVNSHLMLDLPGRLPLGWAPLIEMTGSLETFMCRPRQRYFHHLRARECPREPENDP